MSGNRLTHNGFGALTNLPIGGEANDDGVTARASTYFGLETPYTDGLAGVTLSNNRADRNADLGFDVQGITDAGGQVANHNGNPAECIGVVCDADLDESREIWSNTISFRPLTIAPSSKSNITLEDGQLRHIQ